MLHIHLSSVNCVYPGVIKDYLLIVDTLALKDEISRLPVGRNSFKRTVSTNLSGMFVTNLEILKMNAV